MRKVASRFCLAVTVFCISCTVPQQTVQQPDCTPKSTLCIASKFNDAVIDTSVLYPSGIHYRLTELDAPFNSSYNDNAITCTNDIFVISSDRPITQQAQTLPQHIDAFDRSGIRYSLEFDRSFDVIGTPYFSHREKKIYFTANAESGIGGDYDLFAGEYAVNHTSIVITKVVPLKNINREYSFESQPILSPDGLHLYFVSDRPGGIGGTDIWVSQRSSLSSEWGLPDPLPQPVNTPCDELFPSFSIDGKRFFFASNGHPSVGGYDIVAADYTNGIFSNVKNVREPVNSRYDEIAPYQKDDTSFYFVSSRPAGQSKMNVFTFVKEYRTPRQISSVDTPEVLLFPVRKAPVDAAIRSVELRGTVRSARDTTVPPLNATVFWRDAESSKEIGRKPTDPSGEYSVTVPSGKQYDVGAESKDKFYDVRRVDVRTPTEPIMTVPPLIIPDTLLLRINFPFNDDSNPYEYAISDNGSPLPHKWQTLLDLLKESIDASSSSLSHILIVGHTDYFGTDEFNMGLARRRAQFVANELVKRGVRKNLLKIVSEGERRLLPIRQDEDDDRYRMRLRRVEFIKVFKNK